MLPLLNKTINLKNLERITPYLVAILIAISGIYSYKFMSILMPILVLFLLWLKGGIKKVSFCINPPLIFLFLLIIWGGISILWSIQPLGALKTFLSTSLTFIFFYLFVSILRDASPSLQLKVYSVFKIASFFLIFLIIEQSIYDSFDINLFRKHKDVHYMMKPSGLILALGVFAGCGLLWVNNNKKLSVFVFILINLLIFLTACQTAFLGILPAILVFILSYIAPFWTGRIAVVISYTYLILSPLLYTYFFPLTSLVKLKFIVHNDSLFHRVLGWDFFSEKFLESPLLGWGLNSSRYLAPELDLPPNVPDLLHPHNNSIQAYVELGVVGGILFACLISSLFWLVEKYVKDRLSVAVCNATIVSGFIQAQVTQNLWGNYWLSWLTLLVGLVIIFLKARQAQLHAQGDHLKPAPTQQTEWALPQFLEKKNDQVPLTS